MDIIFSEHALFQIKKRGIPKKLVLKAVINAQEIKPSYRRRKLRRLEVGDKILEVVTRTEGSRVVIITAYYLEEQV